MRPQCSPLAATAATAVAGRAASGTAAGSTVPNEAARANPAAAQTVRMRHMLATTVATRHVRRAHTTTWPRVLAAHGLRRHFRRSCTLSRPANFRGAVWHWRKLGHGAMRPPGHAVVVRSRRESARSASVMSKSLIVNASRAALRTTTDIAALTVSLTPLVPSTRRAPDSKASSMFTVVLVIATSPHSRQHRSNAVMHLGLAITCGAGAGAGRAGSAGPGPGRSSRRRAAGEPGPGAAPPC